MNVSQLSPETIEMFNNITDKDILQDSLTFASMFIAIYEHMADYVVSNIKCFLCDIQVKDGNIVYKKTENYKSDILNRIVDEKGNKDIIKASFLWLVDSGAISKDEYEKFLKIKKIRNKYAHELTSVIYEGINKEEISLLFDMYSLYCNITKWFFVEIEAPILGYEFPKDTNVEQIKTAAAAMFGIALNVLYNGKSETYKKIIETIKKENKM